MKPTRIAFFVSFTALGTVAGASTGNGQPTPAFKAAATTAMTALWRDAAKKESGYPAKWTYDHGLVLKGIEGVWLSTGDGDYFAFIQKGMDHFVENDGTIRTYKLAEYNLDQIIPGKNLLNALQSYRPGKIQKGRDFFANN